MPNPLFQFRCFSLFIIQEHANDKLKQRNKLFQFIHCFSLAEIRDDPAREARRGKIRVIFLHKPL